MSYDVVHEKEKLSYFFILLDIDLEKFNIRIFSNEYQHTIIGDGDYPDNYLELKKWIGDVNE